MIKYNPLLKQTKFYLGVGDTNKSVEIVSGPTFTCDYTLGIFEVPKDSTIQEGENIEYEGLWLYFEGEEFIDAMIQALKAIKKEKTND